MKPTNNGGEYGGKRVLKKKTLGLQTIQKPLEEETLRTLLYVSTEGYGQKSFQGSGKTRKKHSLGGGGGCQKKDGFGGTRETEKGVGNVDRLL